MKHDHQHHHCDCKHERLRFCQKCKVPHCLDCGMEWVTKPATYWYYPYSNGTGQVQGGLTYTSLYQGNTASQTTTNCQVPVTNTTITYHTDDPRLQDACDHAIS